MERPLEAVRSGSTTAVLVARPARPQYLKQLTTLVHRASWQRWANKRLSHCKIVEAPLAGALAVGVALQ
jgi:hypothetical protein